MSAIKMVYSSYSQWVSYAPLWLPFYTFEGGYRVIVALLWRRGVSNYEKLWAMTGRDTQDGQVIVESSD